MRTWEPVKTHEGRLAGIALVLCLCIAGMRAGAATYYVDATAGNDIRAGTSTANAWKTLSRVNWAVLQAGDTVLLKCGEQWRETLTIAESGTAAKPITFSSYGSGAAPVISGADVITGWAALGANRYSAACATSPEIVVFGGTTGTRVSLVASVDTDYEWYWESGTLTVCTPAAPANVEASVRQFPVDAMDVDHVVFKNMEVRYATDAVRIHNTTYATIENVTIHQCAGYAGILVSAADSGRGVQNIIRNCRVWGMTGSTASAVHGGNGHGIFIWGQNISASNTISGNIIHDNGGGGILVIDTSQNAVTGNTVSGSGSAGVVVSGLASARNVIELNTVYGNCLNENDCFGLNLYMPGEGNVVRYNTVHGQYVFTDEEVGVSGFTERSGGIRFDGDTYIGVTGKTGNAVYGNLIYDEFEGIQVFNYSNVAVYNNTIVNTDRSGIYIGNYGAPGTTNNTIVCNNVIHTSGQQLIWHRNAAGTTINRNVYYPDGTQAFNWNGVKYNFSGWKAASGQDAAAVAADPLFTDLAAMNVHLLAGSPALDIADPAYLPVRDIDGVYRPQGSGLDAGAYEYISGPQAAFSGTPRAGISPLGVTFTDLSDPGTSYITAWAWDFDNDGATDSTEQNPVSVYSMAGKHTVSLTVTSAVGVSTHMEADYINVTSGPTADFSASPTAGLTPLDVLFTDASIAGGAAITAWAWDFNSDGTWDSTAQNPTRQFTTGTHSVTLRVTDANGLSDSRTRANLIFVDVPPTASFTAAPVSGYVPLDVAFTDTSSPGSQPILTWLWDFGDGQSSQEQHPAHNYAAAGTYTVALTATTAAASSTATISNMIQVNAVVPPAAQFSLTPTSGIRPLTVSFSDLSTAGTWPIETRLWDFGDGAAGAGANPSHTYETTGFFTVSLTVSNAAGTDVETKAACVEVTNGIQPTADFTADETQGFGPLAVVFTDTSLNGGMPILARLWDFGDGTTSGEAGPSHTYAGPGRYDVSLTVTTANGSDTKSVAPYIFVYDAVRVDVSSTSGIEDGVLWDGAFRTIQAGIDMAQTLGGGDVWVAGGTYGETRSDANGALVLRAGVRVCGGFAGTESARDERDWTVNTCVIDGSAARAGGAAYHVVTGATGATLDGFVVQGGRASTSGAKRDRGAGLYNLSASPTVRHCTFRDNIAAYAGGGVYNDTGASPVMDACRFTANSVTGSFIAQGLGGAMHNTSGVSPVITNCVFSGNTAQATLFSDGLGGAVYNADCAPRFINCSFTGNQSVGAFYSSGDGGAMYNKKASPVLVNNILWGDSPDEIAHSGTGGAQVSYSDVEGGYSGTGNLNIDPLFSAAGDLSLQSDSPCIDRGTGTGAPAADFAGVSRPQGAAVDLGAYEWGALPTAAFSASPLRGLAPLEVSFQDSSSPGSSEIVIWAWDFGDGFSSGEQHPTHNYAAAGLFQATLVVTTAMGTSTAAPVTIEVGAPLEFTAQPQDHYVYVGQEAEFRIETSGGLGGLSYRWWFDDGRKMMLLEESADPALVCSDVILDDTGSYWCEVTDDVRSYVSGAGRLYVAETLQILEQPQGGETEPGDTFEFHIAAAGGFQPLEYIWWRGDTQLDAASGDTLILDQVTPEDAGTYVVEVMDDQGALERSVPAVLTLRTNLPLGGYGFAAVIAGLLAGLGARRVHASTQRRIEKS